MALLWRKTQHGRIYEVRSAGRTRRLYIDGLLNSEYNPAAPLKGTLWELLALPSLLIDPPPSRVLVLGVGAGAVIHQLERMVKPARIVGVDLDPVPLRIARRFFRLDLSSLELHTGEARHWLTQYRGAPFDLIIDDLFTREGREPVRAIKADADWCRELVRHLRPRGAAIFNHIGNRELARSAMLGMPALRARFASAIRLNEPGIENAVLALFGRPLAAGGVKAMLLRELRTRTELRIRAPRFTTRRLF